MKISFFNGHFEFKIQIEANLKFKFQKAVKNLKKIQKRTFQLCNKWISFVDEKNRKIDNCR